MKQIVSLACVIGLVALAPIARAQKVNALPTASSVASTDYTIADDGTTTRRATIAQVGTQIKGTITLSDLPAQANATWVGNTSGSTGAVSPQQPTAMTIMQNGMMSAFVATTGNTTLSGVPGSIDGQAVSAGQIALVWQQTTSSQNGLWVIAAGAWTRATGLPAGFVVGVTCQVNVTVTNGSTYRGQLFRMVLPSGLIVGTSNLTGISNAPYATGTPTVLGVSQLTAGNTAAGMVQSGTTQDCTTQMDDLGSVGDNGNAAGVQGPCVTADASGHPLTSNASGTSPTVNHGTLDAAATDNRGIITGLSAATTVTVTFNASYTYTPACIGQDSAGTITTPSESVSAVTFTMTALTGSLRYICL